MYKIIGVDQKEYGPVTADELRAWIAEGRANGQTPIKPEGGAEWKPLAMFPEFAAALGASRGGPIPPPLELDYTTLPADIHERGYDLDIGHCIGRAWELLKGSFWRVVGSFFIVAIILSVISQILSLVYRFPLNQMIQSHEFSPKILVPILLVTWLSIPIRTIFMGGLYRYYLKLIRRQETSLAEIFSGFTVGIGQFALLGLVSYLIEVVALALCIAPGIYLSVAWCFSAMLVADKNLGFWEAMELSRRIVTKHWFLIFAFLIVFALLSIVGVIACCIGIYISMPLGLVALLYAYEDIFGHRPR